MFRTGFSAGENFIFIRTESAMNSSIAFVACERTDESVSRNRAGDQTQNVLTHLPSVLSDILFPRLIRFCCFSYLLCKTENIREITPLYNHPFNCWSVSIRWLFSITISRLNIHMNQHINQSINQSTHKTRESIKLLINQSIDLSNDRSITQSNTIMKNRPTFSGIALFGRSLLLGQKLAEKIHNTIQQSRWSWNLKV